MAKYGQIIHFLNRQNVRISKIPILLCFGENCFFAKFCSGHNLSKNWAFFAFDTVLWWKLCVKNYRVSARHWSPSKKISKFFCQNIECAIELLSLVSGTKKISRCSAFSWWKLDVLTPILWKVMASDILKANGRRPWPLTVERGGPPRQSLGSVLRCSR